MLAIFISHTGGQALCRALMKNTTLEEVNVGSNEMTEPTAAVLAQVVIHNTTLSHVDLSCNRLGPVSILQSNLTLFILDVL